MSKAYFDLMEHLHDGYDKPHQYLTLQLCFILFLILGQFAALLVWRVIAPWTRSARPWVANLIFGLFLLAAQVALFLAWPQLAGAWMAADNILLADIVITAHLLLVIVVLLVLLLIPVGAALGWKWTRGFWLRLTHLVVIEVVTGQAIVGIECPLKTLERHLRGGYGYLEPEPDKASAIGYWSNQILYTHAEPWVYAVIYSAVALLVLLTWVLWPPRMPWRRSPMEQTSGQPT